MAGTLGKAPAAESTEPPDQPAQSLLRGALFIFAFRETLAERWLVANASFFFFSFFRTARTESELSSN